MEGEEEEGEGSGFLKIMIPLSRYEEKQVGRRLGGAGSRVEVPTQSILYIHESPNAL